MENNHRVEKEKEWCDRIREGDKKAFEEMFFEYYSRLRRFAEGYLKDNASADDIVQELFITLWINHKELNVNYSLASYLYAAARNRAINYLKSNNNARIMEEDDMFLYQESSPEEISIEAELKNMIDDAVETLPPRCKMIFKLHRYDNLKYAEIARILDISENTVITQMGRALKKLRHILTKYLNN